MLKRSSRACLPSPNPRFLEFRRSECYNPPGAEVHLLKNVGLPNDRAFFRDNDFAAIAAAMGAQGITVRDVGDLDQLRSWLDAPLGTMVLDCKVDPQLRGAWFGKVFDPDGCYQRMCGR